MKKFVLTMTSLAAIGTLTSAIGCGGSSQPAPSATPESLPPQAAEHAPHAGHGTGPHDGTLADWGGGKYHVEFTVDHDKQQATVYILGNDEKTPVPIKTEEIQLSISDPVMQVTLKAMPQEGDPEGSASRFVGNHESLGVVQEYAGTITGVVDGTPYSGDFKEEPHAAHDH
ncbi:MAG TPA: hypothetical protein VMM76_05285 [Pirellulaceae bacterium]|nr:hypothetical protein [Pirellulaceae bacterium]